MSRRAYLLSLLVGAGLVTGAALVATLVVTPVTTLPPGTGHGYGALDALGWAALVRNVGLWLAVAATGVTATSLVARRDPVPRWWAWSGLATGWSWVAASSVLLSFAVGFLLYTTLEQQGMAPARSDTSWPALMLWTVGGPVFAVSLLSLLAGYAFSAATTQRAPT